MHGRIRSRAELAQRTAAVDAQQVREAFAGMLACTPSIAVAGRLPRAMSHRIDGWPLADRAQRLIDQLEMLEIKTKGNLDKREEGLLKQGLSLWAFSRGGNTSGYLASL